jgi:uncharacterized Rmd1/YagE family protein
MTWYIPLSLASPTASPRDAAPNDEIRIGVTGPDLTSAGPSVNYYDSDDPAYSSSLPSSGAFQFRQTKLQRANSANRKKVTKSHKRRKMEYDLGVDGPTLRRLEAFCIGEAINTEELFKDFKFGKLDFTSEETYKRDFRWVAENVAEIIHICYVPKDLEVPPEHFLVGRIPSLEVLNSLERENFKVDPSLLFEGENEMLNLRKDLFIFPDQCSVVFWGFSSSEEITIIRKMREVTNCIYITCSTSITPLFYAPL